MIKNIKSPIQLRSNYCAVYFELFLIEKDIEIIYNEWYMESFSMYHFCFGGRKMRFCGACIITNNVSKLSDFYGSIFNALPEGNENHVAFDNMNLAIWNPGNTEISKVKNMSLMYFVDDAKYEYERLLNINGIEMVSEPEM